MTDFDPIQPGTEAALPTLPMQLETERLILRQEGMGDGPLVHEAVADSFDALSQWMDWARRLPTIAEAETRARESAALARTREEYSYLIIERDTDRLVGMIGVHSIEWEVPRFEIGYWQRTSSVGRGYITEAVRRITAELLNNLNARRIEIHCDARNIRSARVAERAGFVFEARLKHHRRDNLGQLTDTLIYVMLPDGQPDDNAG